MIPSWFFEPLPTDIVCSGYANTILPVLPFFEFDGGSSLGSSNTPSDGGNAQYVPVIHDGGCA